MSASEAAEINLDYRPSTYFWPHGLAKHLLARVKGSKRKAALQALIDAGQFDEIPGFLAKSSLTEEERRAIGRIHPAFMGGEYLPDLDETEIEIARISISSTTGDVTSMYARRGKKCIHYRVVDEYGGETLTADTERTSERPLTLGELHRFFMAAWPFTDVLEMNFGDDAAGMLRFFSGSSAFYGRFDALLRQCVTSQYAASGEEL